MSYFKFVNSILTLIILGMFVSCNGTDGKVRTIDVELHLMDFESKPEVNVGGRLYYGYAFNYASWEPGISTVALKERTDDAGMIYLKANLDSSLMNIKVDSYSFRFSREETYFLGDNGKYYDFENHQLKNVNGQLNYFIAYKENPSLANTVPKNVYDSPRSTSKVEFGKSTEGVIFKAGAVAE